jgi:hypothetical protein
MVLQGLERDVPTYMELMKNILSSLLFILIKKPRVKSRICRSELCWEN